MKKYFALCLVAMFTLTSFAKSKETTLSVSLEGFQGDKVYFDCVQTPNIVKEFYANPGEEYIYKFQTDELVEIIINGKTGVILCPGDNLKVTITYEGKNVVSTEFTGTTEAVANNNLNKAVNNIKKQLRYKSQLMSCLVLDIKPKDRLESSSTLLLKTEEKLNSNKKANKDAKAYILAQIEGLVYTSYLEYPQMYEQARNLSISMQDLGDYTKVIDNIKPKDSKVYLEAPEYISMLMLYCMYKTGGERTLEGMYKQIAQFYSGDIRDVLLRNLLVNFIRNGKEIERAEALYTDYKQNYKPSKKSISLINSLLQ